MAIPLGQLIAGAGLATTGAAVTFGGAYVYTNADAIFNWKTQQAIDQSNYEYVVAEAVKVGNGQAKSLFKNSLKNYQCKLGNTVEETKLDAECQVFSLLLTNPSKPDPSINLMRSRFSSNPLKGIIPEPTPITSAHSSPVNPEKSFVVVKLKPEWINNLKDSADKTFSLVESTEDADAMYNLKYVHHLSNEEMVDQMSSFKTSLFLLQSKETSTHATTLSADTEYVCQIGTEATDKLPCKLYQYTLPQQDYTITQLQNLSAVITTPATKLASGYYAVINLLDAKKTYRDLQYKDITVSLKTDSTKITKGRMFSLLVGKVSETSGESAIYPVSNIEDQAPTPITPNAETTHILTGGSEVFKNMTSMSNTSYLCRVIQGDKYFDDEECKLLEVKQSISQSAPLQSTDYTSATEITDANKLATGKHQVVEMKKALKDKLSELDAAHQVIHIVKKGDKGKAWNNRIATLTIPASNVSVTVSAAG